MTNKPVREIPAALTKIDRATGEVTHEPMAWKLLPPAPGTCPFCARKHLDIEPHDATSLYYIWTFHSQIGRSPTWADALAHCTADMRLAWERLLREKNAWTEPPAGEMPVAHHGVS
jgi:hypothetical protein